MGARHATGYYHELFPRRRDSEYSPAPFDAEATMTTDSLALDFKSATLYAVRVVLHSANMQELTDALDKRMHDAGSFFENEPVVIDASRVQAPVDWQALVKALRAHNLPPIGAIGSTENAAGALEAGLAHVELSTTSARASQSNAAVTTDALDAPVPTQPAADIALGAVTPTADDAAITEAGASLTATAGAGQNALDIETTPGSASEAAVEPALGRRATPGPDSAAPAARAPQSASALVITKPLRSGQRVYARHSDLIVIGMVSQGAEVIADGNIHVYGPLRGKAMAGARGDASARIFTTELDAELLAVAGVYRVVEARLNDNLRNRPALVRLDGDSLRIESLKP